ncbi:hypothetical protein F4824DRAFT_308414 [Ustulina deusta]|nr:hypothetical protein F4823DRAFT_167855 [Ustulina deusta]KAI3341276.1 hypothetical protein F4824DRAFT_308414 [Ustulina deusta]
MNLFSSTSGQPRYHGLVINTCLSSSLFPLALFSLLRHPRYFGFKGYDTILSCFINSIAYSSLLVLSLSCSYPPPLLQDYYDRHDYCYYYLLRCRQPSVILDLEEVY